MSTANSDSTKPLSGRVCLVTGASRGIGRGIALQLGEAGATVYITGRTLEPPSGENVVPGSLRSTANEITERGGICIPVKCDHSKDEDIRQLFEKIKSEQDNRLDILVNNAYSAVNAIMDNLKKPFWEQSVGMWDDVNNVGLRNHYICSVYASQIMVPRKSGLIVNISSFGGLKYVFNVAYGVGKQAVDRMAADMAIELKPHSIACVSLWPGAVRTEEIQHALDSGKIEEAYKDDPVMSKMGDSFRNGETTEFSGKAIVSLAGDKNIMNKTGKILLTSELGAEYGFKDIDGKTIGSIREMKAAIQMSGYTNLAKVVPSFVKLPYWMLALSGNKFG